MGAVFKKTYTKPVPAGARIVNRNGKRQAQWRDSKGKLRRADLTTSRDGKERILLTAGTYTAKYRDGQGLLREETTGCRDEAAARSVLSSLERRAEKVRGGLLTASEAAAIDHQELPLSQLFDAYLVKLRSGGTSAVHHDNVRRCLRRVARDCKFTRLANFSREALERWLVAEQEAGMSARTRNVHRAALVAFCNWCVETKRSVSNPFTKVAKADEDLDPRRRRRSLTEDELVRLLEAARKRPLLDASTVRRGKRKGQIAATLKDTTRDRLERLGWERALIYKTLVLTGLRKGELASLTVQQVRLDAPTPYLLLNAADEKNRQGAHIPLRVDLADDLRRWVASMRPAGTKELPPSTPLFSVPNGLIRILDRDLVAAGIARRVQVAPNKWVIDKRDERGRTIDVHALRHTFGTLLSAGGVMPRTAQAAMRHSDVNLTMNVYTDPKLLDVAAALESLPALRLPACLDGQELQGNVEALSVTSNGFRDSEHAPTLAPTTVQTRQMGAIVDRIAASAHDCGNNAAVAVDVSADKDLRPLSALDNGRHQARVKGLEPSASSVTG